MTITNITRQMVGLKEPKESEEETNKTFNKQHNAVTLLPNASSEMTKVLQTQDDFGLPKEGDLIRGTVVSISKGGIVVDINGRLTGIVRGKELDDESGEYSKLSIGESAEATVLDLENEQGMLELSFRQAGHRKAWDFLQKILEEGEVVDAKVADANKGGLMVKVGNVEGFLPVSQLTVEHYPRVEGGDKNRILERLKAYSGQVFKVKIITVKEKEEKLIVSEKSAWEKVISEKGKEMEFEGLSSKGKTGLRKDMLKTAQEESGQQKAPDTTKQDKKAAKEKFLAGILGKGGENNNNNRNEPNILEKIHANNPQQPQNLAQKGFVSMADFQQQKAQQKQQKKTAQNQKNQKANINTPAGFGIQNTESETPKGAQELQI